MWFAVGLDGTLLTDEPARAAPRLRHPRPPPPAPPALVQVAPTDLGDVMVDEGGLTLYGFTKDADGQPTCAGDCADAWPPLLVDGAELPAGLDPAIFSVVERDDGSDPAQGREVAAVPVRR